MVPDALYHYYEQSRGPFRNLSDLLQDEAEAVMVLLRQQRDGFASERNADYIAVRRELEDRVRQRFIAKGGQPQRERPHYMTVGACEWVKGWYTHGCALSILLTRFTPEQVSFTYGDLFPAMRYGDGKPYRQQVYTLPELPELIATYDLPQVWNADGRQGPDRYIEAQIWDDAPLSAYRASVSR